MLLSLEEDQNIDFLKFNALMRLRHLKLPRSATEKFNKILHDDTIQPDEFMRELSVILKSKDTFTWKIVVYCSNLQKKFLDQISQLSILQVFLFCCFFVLLFFLDKQFKSTSKKIRTKAKILSETILLRIFALAGYFIPIISLYNAYLTRLLRPYPDLGILISPSFIRKAMVLYLNIPFIEYIYFFSVVWLCINFKFPKPRFIRFHFMRGLLLYTFEQVPLLFFEVFTMAHRAGPKTEMQQPFTLLLFCFCLNLYFLVPALLEAISLSYPKRWLIREAIEVQLGRDNTEGFKWWDRDK